MVARDAAADGTFVYSVRTTGVYCRPSCAARPARPENVRFHATGADAAAAGFRPCKRCKPDQPSLRRAAGRDGDAGLPAHREPPRRRRAWRRWPSDAGLSPYHFHRVFRAVTGLTPRAYAAAHRGKPGARESSRGAAP